MLWYKAGIIKTLNIKWNIRGVKHKRYKKLEAENIIAFDIETTSGIRLKNNTVKLADYTVTPEEGEPVALMYVWQIAIESGDDIIVIMGRTWDEYLSLLNELTEDVQRKYLKIDYNMSLSVKLKPINIHIYIHNLGFEFQFLRNIHAFDGKKIFAREPRKPMRVEINVNNNKIIYHDTLRLTQKTLKNWGKDANLKVIKQDEGQDFYMKMRTPFTPLTDEEISYSINDVVTMIYGMKKYRELFGDLGNIPMTQTGIVRKKCKTFIGSDEAWSEKCKDITLSYDFERYNDFQALFVGGWTHANAIHSNKTNKNIICYDFRSSYPAVMVSRKYPIGAFETCDASELKDLIKGDINDREYRFYIHFKVNNCMTNTLNTFWSSSKCINLKNPVFDNGKIYGCESMEVIMTDLDFDVFIKAYDFNNLEIIELRKAKRGYLSKKFIETILDYYGKKTSLKGLDDKISMYNESKQWINSIYGCAVTKVVTDNVDYIDNEWIKQPATENDYYERIENDTKGKCWTTYQIGCWVTAWARHNLWDAIYKLDRKVVYCDTDSIKGMFNEEDIAWFNNYNKDVLKQCEKVADYYNMDIELWKPKTIKGKSKEIGYFDREDDCLEFKTLGAKKYCDTILKPIEKCSSKDKVIAEIEKDGKRFGKVLQVTISGITKAKGAAKFNSVDEFKPEVTWSAEESGKLTSFYNDEQPTCEWIDYNGVKYTSTDKYGLSLIPATYAIGITTEYDLLIKILEGASDVWNNRPGIVINRFLNCIDK